MAAVVEHSDKYDRQLRLWGERGQRLLESAKVVLLGASAVGTETLKNLVLPAVGSFTIVDGETVNEEDLGRNFFVTIDDLGKGRAETTCQLLLELNPDVSGTFVATDPVEMINNNLEFFDTYSVVIGTNLKENALSRLSKYLFEKSIPLIHIHINGLIALVRLQVPEHIVADSKQPQAPDLRLTDPWPALLEAVPDLSSLPDNEVALLPSVLIALSALSGWRAENEGRYPGTYGEAQRLITQIVERMPFYENVAEIRKFNRALYLNPKDMITDQLRSLFDDPQATISLNPHSKPFWIIVSALKDFSERRISQGSSPLPLRGDLPDLNCSTTSYLNLQRIFQEKAQEDLEELRSIVVEKLVSLGKHPEAIPSSDILFYSRNASSLRVIRTRSIFEDISSRLVLNPADGWSKWVALIRATEKFREEYSRFPGDTEDYEADLAIFQRFVRQTCPSLFDCDVDIPSELVGEFVRYGGSELHVVAASIGGIAAQEITKILTNLWTPINDSFLFDGTKLQSFSFSISI